MNPGFKYAQTNHKTKEDLVELPLLHRMLNTFNKICEQKVYTLLDSVPSKMHTIYDSWIRSDRLSGQSFDDIFQSTWMHSSHDVTIV